MNNFRGNAEALIDTLPLFTNTLPMEAVPVTRAYLETLSAGELIAAAEEWGLDIPPDLERIFIIEEILEISSQDDDSVIVPEQDMNDLIYTESAPLPCQYNITFIEVMIRDPFWAFVFWEIKALEKEQFEKDPDFEGYYLKVSPYSSPRGASPSGADAVFTVPVKPEDTAWYLGLNPAGTDEVSRMDQSRFKVEICVSVKGVETILAASGSLSLPSLHSRAEKSASAGASAGNNPLVRLSGYEHFHTLRNSERLLRTKRGGSFAL